MVGARQILVLLGCVGLLAGCGGTGGRIVDTLGLSRTPPDEFQVVQRAPLVLPPDYALRPPQPGAPRPQEPSSREAARAALTGTAPAAGAASGASGGQAALLAQAGAAAADPEIRSKIAADSGLTEVDDRLFAYVLWWQRGQREAGEVLDPVAEAERLRQGGAAAGAAVPGGPSIERVRQEPLLVEGSS